VSGYEVGRRLKADMRIRLIPVVILTGHTAANARLKACELGANDFLIRPFPAADVLTR
jgi:putative two-component system response regulator